MYFEEVCLYAAKVHVYRTQRIPHNIRANPDFFGRITTRKIPIVISQTRSIYVTLGIQHYLIPGKKITAMITFRI